MGPSNSVAVEFLHRVRRVEGAEGLSQAARPSGVGKAAAVTFGRAPLAANITWSRGAADELPKEMLLFVKAETR